MYEIQCTVEGLVDSMWDRFYNLEETETPTPKKSKKSWKANLIKKLYVDKKGVYCPADNLKMMLIGNTHRTGAAKILGTYIETGKGTQYLQYCASMVWVVGIEDSKKVYFKPLRKTYNDYDERSFINANGSRSITRRPLVTVPWSLTFRIHVMDNQYDESKIKEFFIVAGMRCGIGAYGPTFGRFIIKKWEVVGKKKKAR